MHLRRVLTLAACLFAVHGADAQQSITIATWNLEHMGSPGRGFGGIGAGSLPPRTDAEIQRLADFIRINVGADVLALQEVGVTHRDGVLIRSQPMDRLVQALGPHWRYALPPVHEIPPTNAIHNLHCAYLWESTRVRLDSAFCLNLPEIEVGGARVFARQPYAAYFQALRRVDAGDNAITLERTNDFLLINAHLKSGQDNDENHLVATIIAERALNRALEANRVRESDRISLGDFNDNPWSRDDNGNPRYLDFLYKYMEAKGYRNLMSEQQGYTRMNAARSSIIDHIMANRSAMRHIIGTSAEVIRPADTSDAGLATWRRAHSDHFPVRISLRVEASDDDVDWSP